MPSEGQAQKFPGKILLILALALIVNSVYMTAFGGPNFFDVLNGLLHPLLGIATAFLFVLYLIRNRRTFGGALGSLSVALLAGAGALGIYLALVGMTRPHSWALYAHVGAAVGGLLFLFAHLRPRPSAAGDSPPGRSAWRSSLAVALASTGFYAAAALYHRLHPGYLIRNPSMPPLTMEQEGGGAISFMFPSSAQTPNGRPIRADFFMNSESCKRCHADIYEQWFSSMHHFASFNNQWYRKSIEYMQDTIGVKSSLWCGGCHDHALVLSGMIQKRPIRRVINTREAQNGLRL